MSADPGSKAPSARKLGLFGVVATIGVAVSITVMALAGHYLLGLPWELAVLLGAVTSPTDASVRLGSDRAPMA